ncbi:hypothetical protein PIB30_040704 [Stylosanthes scabra]|uniref:Uncharacterized protein n=1 Tax=Stylosanthes scabra TaxID=79078 RepID=A0ABU6SEL2_9FABA|nr:hypothetical protein [Stylosanthes scabra]
MTIWLQNNCWINIGMILRSSDGNNFSKVNSRGSTGKEKPNYNNESQPLINSDDNTKFVIPLMESSLKGTENLDTGSKLAAVDNDGSFKGERNSNVVKNAVNTSGGFLTHVDEVRLEEEMRILDQNIETLKLSRRNLKEMQNNRMSGVY